MWCQLSPKYEWKWSQMRSSEETRLKKQTLGTRWPDGGRQCFTSGTFSFQPWLQPIKHKQQNSARPTEADPAFPSLHQTCASHPNRPPWERGAHGSRDGPHLTLHLEVCLWTPGSSLSRPAPASRCPRGASGWDSRWGCRPTRGFNKYPPSWLARVARTEDYRLAGLHNGNYLSSGG